MYEFISVSISEEDLSFQQILNIVLVKNAVVTLLIVTESKNILFGT